MTEVENSLQMNLSCSVMIEESKDKHLHPETLRRMDLQREEIDVSWIVPRH